MAFAIATRKAKAGDKSGTVYTLEDRKRGCMAEVWPFLGFNCLKWRVKNSDGTTGDVLYTAPDWEANPVPTRSGHPILFPFPNRFRGGQFAFAGKTYQLPLNESSGKHAIHGFTPRNAWTVVSALADDDQASIIGRFQLSENLPEAAAHWPGDPTITLTYTLTADALRVDAEIENPTAVPLPCGLGYHPYFCIPTAPGANADEMTLVTPASTLWKADDGIPTGERVPVPDELDFRQKRSIGGLVLDRLFGDLGLDDAEAGDLTRVARLGHTTARGELTVSVSPSFRELLLFTPPHRKAVAIEPYTCASDAANLQAAGHDSGWAVLPPEAKWSTTVEYRWTENPED